MCVCVCNEGVLVQSGIKLLTKFNVMNMKPPGCGCLQDPIFMKYWLDQHVDSIKCELKLCDYRVYTESGNGLISIIHGLDKAHLYNNIHVQYHKSVMIIKTVDNLNIRPFPDSV